MAEADRQYMGTAADAKAALIEKARAWRETRQPCTDTAAGHRKREPLEQELRFQLANAALLWLWHEENPEAAPISSAEPTPAQKAYALLWREMRVSDKPFVREARAALLASLTLAEQRAAIAWVKGKYPVEENEVARL